MLTVNQEHVMINLILHRRKKHLTELKENEPSQVKVWEKFYEKMLDKYSVNCEVSSYGYSI